MTSINLAHFLSLLHSFIIYGLFLSCKPDLFLKKKERVWWTVYTSHVPTTLNIIKTRPYRNFFSYFNHYFSHLRCIPVVCYDTVHDTQVWGMSSMSVCRLEISIQNRVEKAFLTKVIPYHHYRSYTFIIREVVQCRSVMSFVHDLLKALFNVA